MFIFRKYLYLELIHKHSPCSKFIPNFSSVCRQFLPSCLLPKLFLEIWLWTDTKNEETITYETAQTSTLSWLKMLKYFGKYETNSPQLTDFGLVSVLEEWAGSGSAGSLTHVDCSAIV